MLNGLGNRILRSNKALRDSFLVRDAALERLGKAGFEGAVWPKMCILNKRMLETHEGPASLTALYMRGLDVEEKAMWVCAAAQLTEDILCRPGVN